MPGLRLNELRIANFKAFAFEQRVPLRPITLIYGANSAGKSSVLHAVALAHHAIHTGTCDVARTRLGGDSIDLGGFRQYVHRRNPERLVRLGFEIDPGAVSGGRLHGAGELVCTAEIGFSRKRARYLRVAEFIRQRDTCSELDVYAEFGTSGRAQDSDLARAQMSKHWIRRENACTTGRNPSGGLRGFREPETPPRYRSSQRGISGHTCQRLACSWFTRKRVRLGPLPRPLPDQQSARDLPTEWIRYVRERGNHDVDTFGTSGSR